VNVAATIWQGAGMCGAADARAANTFSLRERRSEVPVQSESFLSQGGASGASAFQRV